MIERERPTRRPFIPRQVIIGVVAAIAAIALTIGLVLYFGGRSMSAVPDVVGLSEDVARVRLAQAGFEMTISERPFDRSEEGTVLGQDPEPGTLVREGDVIAVIVSSGTEQVELPDVTGTSSRVARAQLEALGLTVRLTPMASEEPTDTVLAQNPSPGATVRTGSIVNLTVAAESSASDALLPYTLTNTTFILDPAYYEDAPGDVAMEVTRKLGALLQASGAVVEFTRSAAATDTSEVARAASIGGATATAIVGLNAPATGEAGFQVVTLAENVAPSTYETSRLLADEAASLLGESGAVVDRSTVGSDLVLQAPDAPGIRIRLGSYADTEDAAYFADPTWADDTARAVYRALGERFGS